MSKVGLEELVDLEVYQVDQVKLAEQDVGYFQTIVIQVTILVVLRPQHYGDKSDRQEIQGLLVKGVHLISEKYQRHKSTSFRLEHAIVTIDILNFLKQYNIT